ncbi:MAG: hypothetical protein GKR87_13485 [Kiritimatiellae bacterium]|nr:hypothetical protein [Kiritimatiellia bacterium]
MSNYKWELNLACIATYKVLEGDQLLDQFEEADVSFDDAKSLSMGGLRFYPKTTTNSDIIELVSFEIARKYLKLIIKGYSVKKEKTQITSSEIIIALAFIFSKKDATVKDLAERTDLLIRFSDE